MMRNKQIVAALALALASVPTGGQATLPTLPPPTLPVVNIGTAPLMSVTQAETYYSGASKTATHYKQNVAPPEIVELARALKNNPDLIYEYVRNNIETVWMYGLHKGPLGTLIDRAGTSFDQAALMVALLRQAGYTASFQAGTFAPSPSDFTAWSGIGDAKAACQMLSSGGIPAQINGSTLADCSYAANTAITSITIAHVWVRVTIPLSTCTSTCLYDPSFKTHTWKDGIDLVTASGFSPGTPLNNATGAMGTGNLSANNASVPFVNNLGAGTLNTTLSNNAGALITYLKDHNLLAAHMDDIVGGGVTVPYYAPSNGLRQGTLSGHSSSHDWTSIPDVYRATLRVAGQMFDYHDLSNPTTDTMFDVTYFADEIYGRAMTVDTDYNLQSIHQQPDYWPNTITLKIDGETAPVPDGYAYPVPYVNHPYPGAPHITSRGLGSSMTLVADHPYAASNGTYMDQTVTKNVTLITSLAVVHAWGDTGPGLLAKFSSERGSDSAMPYPLHPPQCAQDTCPPYYVGSTGDFTRVKTAANWLAQYTRATQLHTNIAKAVAQLHHAIGFLYADNALTVQYVNIYGDPDWIVNDNFDRLDVDSAFSLTSKTADASARRAAVQAIAASSATLEGSVSSQMGDMPDATSVATRFEWGNAPPSAEDPSSAGVRNFLQFKSNNMGSGGTIDETHNSAATLALAENMTSTDFYDLIDYGSQPILTSTQVTAFRNSLSKQIYNYATAGFTVVASQEAFLGPGQRGGAPNVLYTTGFKGGIHLPGVPEGYTDTATKQRGGAFVATKYDANGDPVQIAHDVTGVSGSWDGASFVSKGGGAGNQPDSMTMYAPSEPADVLKSRFADKSNALGVNLSSGVLTPPGAPALEVGKGGAPYSLSAFYAWNSVPMPNFFNAPTVPTQPGWGWTTNWQNNLSISGSGMEAMGSSDVRAAAGTIVAFLATQDIYKATQSAGRDVAAVLAQSWWAHQMSGNVVNVQIGTSSRSFVKLATGAWVAPGGGSYSKLLQTGTRAPFEFLCADGTRPPPYATSRGWDNSGLAFDVIGAGGDVQHFAYWENSYTTQGSKQCGRVNGFRLTTWTAANGIKTTLTYGDPQDINALQGGTGIERITSVQNSLGRQIVFGADASLTGSDGRHVTLTGASGSATFGDPAGIQTKFVVGGTAARSDTQRPVVAAKVLQIFTADNSNLPNTQYDYDTLGRIKQVRDAINLQVGDGSVAGGRNPTQFYIADGTRGERDDPMGAAYTVYYDSYAMPSRYVDELGRETDQEHDGRGRVTRTTYPEGDYETLTYDARNNPLTLVLHPKPGSAEATAGQTIAKSTAYSEGEAVTECANYYTCNKPLSSISPNGNTTSYTWTSVGLLSKIKLPGDSPNNDRPETDYTYSAFGADSFKLLTSKKQYIQRTPSVVTVSTDYTYNSSNYYTPQTVAIDPAGLNLVTTLTYDSTGNVTQVDGPRSDVTDTSYFTYDLDRRTIFAISADPDGGGSQPRVATKKIYDVVGRLAETDRGTTTSTAGSGFTLNDWVKESYDPAGNRTLAITGTGTGANASTSTATQFTYDANNRVLCSAKRLNPATYGTLPADACTLSPSGTYGPDRIVKTIYDAAGQLRQEVRAFGTPVAQVYVTHDFSLDGQEVAIADADAGIVIGAYDLDETTAHAHQTNFFNDGFTRLKTTTFADGTYESLTYDNDGNVLARRNRSNQIITSTFDKLDRALTRTTPAYSGGSANTATIAYDLVGQTLGISDSAGNALASTYDFAGRQLTASQTFSGLPGAKTVTYAYDNGAGNKTARSRMTWPDGFYVNYAYDAISHLTTATDSDGTVLASRTYDILARPATTQYPNVNDNIGYGWDAQDNLTALDDNFNGTTADVSFTNEFTPGQGLWWSDISKAAYKYSPPSSGTDSYAAANALNQYTAMTPAGQSTPPSNGHDCLGNAQAISYDCNGNLTGDGIWTYGYNPENQLMTASKTGVAAAYLYDPLGRRIKNSGTGVTGTYFLHDGDNEIAEYDLTGALVRRFVPGPVIDQPVAMIDCTGSGCAGANAAKTYFHPDKMGSIIAMSDASGNRVEGPFVYDAYGNCFKNGNPCSSGVPYRYTGQRLDPETGLYYYRARYYASAIGRFLQTDPIGTKDDLNLYMYVHDDPANGADPLGLEDLTLQFLRNKTIQVHIDDTLPQADRDVARQQLTAAAALTLRMDRTGRLSTAAARALGALGGITVSTAIPGTTNGIFNMRASEMTQLHNDWQGIQGAEAVLTAGNVIHDGYHVVQAANHRSVKDAFPGDPLANGRHPSRSEFMQYAHVILRTEREAIFVQADFIRSAVPDMPQYSAEGAASWTESQSDVDILNRFLGRTP